MDDGVVAAALELIAIEEARRELETDGGSAAFTPEELAYARARSDPERRLAARLAAKRAVLRLLGGGLTLRDAEIRRGATGPPALRLSPRAEALLRERGAFRVLVSLTHGRLHAAASVLLVRDPG